MSNRTLNAMVAGAFAVAVGTLAATSATAQSEADMEKCQSALDWDPRSASKGDPFDRRILPVALGSSELAGIAETSRARLA